MLIEIFNYKLWKAYFRARIWVRNFAHVLCKNDWRFFLGLFLWLVETYIYHYHYSEITQDDSLEVQATDLCKEN